MSAPDKMSLHLSRIFTPSGSAFSHPAFAVNPLITADLGGEGESVDGVLRAGAVGDAEVHDELTDAVLVGQWPGRHVDIVTVTRSR